MTTTTATTTATSTGVKSLPSPYPELNRAVHVIRDTLEDCEIPHVVEADPENPHVFTCAAFDGDYVNTGMVGWNADQARVIFIAFNPEAIRQSELEDIPPEDSKDGWDARDIDTFLLFLMGDIREVIAEIRAKMAAAQSVRVDNGDDQAAGQ